jgi:drug/metabolite transporter (DMT)-like permease
MGIVFCLAGAFCFTAFYLVLDFSQRRKADALGLNLATFLTGVLLSVAAAGGIRAGQFPPALLAIGSLIGIAAGFGLLGITLAVRSGMSISIVNTAVSLCLALPIVLSLALYGEVPGLRKTFGLAFAVASIYLIQRERA